MFQVEWIDNNENRIDVLGLYDDYQQATQSILDWWNANSYTPPYCRIIGDIETDKKVTIDYGLYSSFYRIRSVKNKLSFSEVSSNNYYTEYSNSTFTIKRNTNNSDGRIKCELFVNTKYGADKKTFQTKYTMTLPTNNSGILNFEPLDYALKNIVSGELSNE